MEKKKIMYIVFAVLFVLLIAILLFFVSKDRNDSHTDTNLTYENFVILKGHKGEVKEYDKSIYVDGYKGSYDEAYYITGKLKNNGEGKDFVVIRFNLFDEKGNLLGEAIAGLNKVSKDKEYDFKAMSTTTTENAKKVAKYVLKSISAE